MTSTDTALSKKPPTENVLFVQRLLPHYRVPIFNKLGEASGINLTLGLLNRKEESGQLNFKIEELKSTTKLGFCLRTNLKKIENRFDTIIIPFDLHEIGCLKLLLSRDTSKKTILFGHSHGRNKKLRQIRRTLIRRASATVVYTPLGRQRLIDEGVSPNKLFVANNTVEVKNNEFQSNLERRSFLFVGRLTARKQITDLVSAFNLAKSKLPHEIQIEIIGNGNQKTVIKSLVNELGLSTRVKIHGEVLCDTKLKEIFSRAIAYVSPGHVGLGVVHSFAYGIPVVTTDHSRHAPEFSYIVDSKNGILYDGDISSLSTILINLARERRLSYSLGANAFRFFKSNLTIGKPIEGFIDAIHYSGICRKHNS